MLAGFQNHFGRAENGLRGELRRDVARQAGGDAAVAQRLDELINVSRAAAAQAGHGVEQSFLHLKRDADGGQKFFRQFAVRRQSRICRARTRRRTRRRARACWA